MNKILWMTLMTLPGLMVPEVGFGEPGLIPNQKNEVDAWYNGLPLAQKKPIDDKYGTFSADKKKVEGGKLVYPDELYVIGHEYKNLTDDEKTKLAAAEDLYRHKGQIKTDTPTKILWFLKADPENSYGDTQCGVWYLGTLNLKREDSFLNFMLQCNQSSTTIPTTSYTFSSVFRHRTFEQIEEELLKNEKGIAFYNQWTNKEERLKNILFVDLLGTLSRHPRLKSDKKTLLEKCVKGYNAQTLSSIPSDCASFIVTSDTAESNLREPIPEKVIDKPIGTPYERSLQRTGQAREVYESYRKKLLQQSEENTCVQNAQNYLAHNIASYETGLIAIDKIDKILTANEAQQISDHFEKAYQLAWGRKRSSSEPSHHVLEKVTDAVKKTAHQINKAMPAVVHDTAHNVLKFFEKLPLTKRGRSQSDPTPKAQPKCVFEDRGHHASPDIRISHYADQGCNLNKKYREKLIEILNADKSTAVLLAEILDPMAKLVATKIDDWVTFFSGRPNPARNAPKSAYELAYELEEEEYIKLITSYNNACQPDGVATKDADWGWVMVDRFFDNLIEKLDDRIKEEKNVHKKAELKQVKTKLTAQREKWKTVSF